MAPRNVIWDELARREFLLGFSARKAAKKAKYAAALKRAAAEEKIETDKRERKEMKNYLKQLRRAKRAAQTSPSENVSEADSRESQEVSKHIVEDDGSFYGRTSAKVRIEISNSIPS